MYVVNCRVGQVITHGRCPAATDTPCWEGRRLRQKLDHWTDQTEQIVWSHLHQGDRGYNTSEDNCVLIVWCLELSSIRSGDTWCTCHACDIHAGDFDKRVRKLFELSLKLWFRHT